MSHARLGVALTLALPLLCPTRSIAGEPGELFSRMRPFGDLRLRAEAQQSSCADERWRPRLRLRLGTTVDFSHDVRAEIRVTTGDPGDPRSPHQTFGSGGGKFALSLDRACLHWSPALAPGLQITGGKFGQRLPRSSVYGELLQDADVHPTGVLATWARQADTSPSAGIGSYMLDEQSAGEDTYAVVAQAGMRHKTRGGMQLRGSVDAFLLFVGDGTTVDKLGHPTGRGNLVENSIFVSRFRVVHAFIEFAQPLAGRPVTLSIGGMHNTRAASSDDSGWFSGATLAGGTSPHAWDVFFQYQEVAQEAVFTPWSQDDWPDDRGSGFRGFVAGGDVGLSARVSLRAWALASTAHRTQASAADCWLMRYRADLNASF